MSGAKQSSDQKTVQQEQSPKGELGCAHLWCSAHLCPQIEVVVLSVGAVPVVVRHGDIAVLHVRFGVRAAQTERHVLVVL